jgi:hypothetical protein
MVYSIQGCRLIFGMSFLPCLLLALSISSTFSLFSWYGCYLSAYKNKLYLVLLYSIRLIFYVRGKKLIVITMKNKVYFFFRFQSSCPADRYYRVLSHILPN